MRCADFRERVPALLDGTADDALRRALARHMADCDACAALVEDDALWLDAVRRVLDHRAPPDLRDAVLAAAGLEAGADPGGAPPRATWGAVARHVRRGLTWRTWLEAAAAAAVVIVAVQWLVGRDAPAAAPFDRPGAVRRLEAPSAAGAVDADGSYFLTDRLI